MDEPTEIDRKFLTEYKLVQVVHIHRPTFEEMSYYCIARNAIILECVTLYLELQLNANSKLAREASRKYKSHGML